MIKWWRIDASGALCALVALTTVHAQATSGATAVVASEFINEHAPYRSSHASTIAETAAGDLVHFRTHTRASFLLRTDLAPLCMYGTQAGVEVERGGLLDAGSVPLRTSNPAPYCRRGTLPENPTTRRYAVCFPPSTKTER